MSTSPKVVVKRANELPFLVRVLWFFIVGLEATAVWILVAWALNVTIIGLPLGVWMLDRVPQVLTLKARGGAYVYDAFGEGRFIPDRQVPFLLRAFYFLLFGWWLSLLWAIVAYLFCATIIGLPIGLLMLNSLPFVTTLHHN